MNLIKYICLILLILPLGCRQADQKKELKLIGHRGAAGLLPENTIPSFKKAVELGVNRIELDVFISGDNQVVISHEPWFRHDICLTPEGDPIDKKTQKNHLIYEMSYKQIAKYDCGSIQHPDFPNQKNRPLAKPLLKEAVNKVESFARKNGYDSTYYHIEFKGKPSWDNKMQPEPSVVVQLVHDALAELEILDRVSVHSFDERMLQAFKKIESSVPQMYSIRKKNTNLEENLETLGYAPDVYFPNYEYIDSTLVKEAHDKGMLIIPWTVDEVDDMMRLVDMGVDGILSNYPNHFKKLQDNQMVNNIP